MKRLGVALLPLVLIGAIAADGCGKQSGQIVPGPADVVSMSSTTFLQHAVTINAGSQLHIVDPAGTGGVHILCLGHDMTCTPNLKGPAELNTGNDISGLQFTPGDSKFFTFATPGTYEVTCTIHQHMNLIVTVQ